MTGQDRTDGPDELAEAIAWFWGDPKRLACLDRATALAIDLQHAATIVRAVLARPDTATGGRDLTAQDVESALDNYTSSMTYGHVAEHLNWIARPVRPDTAAGDPDGVQQETR